MKKRLFCLCLALVLLLSAVPMAAAAPLYSCNFSNYDVTYPAEGGVIYFDKDFGAVIDCDTTVTAVNIPEQIDGVPVTRILCRAFFACDQLASVTLPETLTYIGEEAFYKCSSLLSVDLPDSLRHLGKEAFVGTHCATYMGSGFYVDGWLTRASAPSPELFPRAIHVEEGTVGIGAEALNYYSDLVRSYDVYLPASLRYLSIDAMVHDGSVYFSEDGLYLEPGTGGVFTKDGKSLVYALPSYDIYGNPLPYYVVPEGVETIEQDAFASSMWLKNVTLPDSLVTIGDCAFRGSALQSVSFGKNVKSVGDFAFDGCDLSYVNLGESLETVGIYAFHENQALQTVALPATVKCIGEGAFYHCDSLREVYFEGDAPELGANAFRTGFSVDRTNGYNTIFETYPIPALKLYHRAYRAGWSELTEYTTALWEGSVHFHDFRLEVREANCLEDGRVYNVCACGETHEIAVLPSSGHQYNVWHGNCIHCGKKGGMNDVTDRDWFAPGVYYALKNGLMNGVSEFVFAPDTAMTRAMLVTVLWRYEGEPEGYENTFQDVNGKSGSWYIDAVAWAAANGIVDGVGNGKFDPNGNITREQMAAILYRYSEAKGIDTSKQGSLSGFPDANKVSSYANTALQWTVAEGIIGGSDGKLLPQGNATRAQVATILKRFIENTAKDEEQPSAEKNSLNMYMFGNSLLYHGQSESLGWSGNWGMAASSAENDYAHRLNVLLAGQYGEVSYTTAAIGAYETAIAARDDVDASAALASCEEQFRTYCAVDVPEIVTIQMGENVSDTALSAAQYQDAVMQLISMVRTYAPDCGIVLCTPFWGGEAKIAAVEQIAAEADRVQIARLDTLNTEENKAIGLFEHPGVAAHPSDTGMEKIAALIFDAAELLLAEIL